MHVGGGEGEGSEQVCVGGVGGGRFITGVSMRKWGGVWLRAGVYVGGGLGGCWV